MRVQNLLADVVAAAPEERIDLLVRTAGLRLERIVSTGQATPPGQWYDQPTDEWVMVVEGRAGLRFEGADATVVMERGDHVLIAAHRRHRVEWTDTTMPTVWLALHHSPASGPDPGCSDGT